MQLSPQWIVVRVQDTANPTQDEWPVLAILHGEPLANRLGVAQLLLANVGKEPRARLCLLLAALAAALFVLILLGHIPDLFPACRCP